MLYHLTGSPVIAWRDTAIQELRQLVDGHRPEPNDASRKGHLILILDNDLQCFPWESLPVLRGRATSRLPTLAFLIERLDMIIAPETYGFLPKHHHIDGVDVDRDSLHYVINPGGDLKQTEERFAGIFSQNKQWQGSVGVRPEEPDIVQALAQRHIFA